MYPPKPEFPVAAAPNRFVRRQLGPWYGRRLALVCTLGVVCVACGADETRAAPAPAPAPAPRLGRGAGSPDLGGLLGILDGNLSQAKEYGATGAILYTSTGVSRTRPPIGAMICSGTLIAPDVVLAAGHCREHVVDRGGATLTYYFSLDDDVSGFGPHVRALPQDAVRVAHFAAHPDYGVVAEPGQLRHVADIALLYLERPIAHVPPAELLPAHLAHTLREGQEVMIVGYGRRNLHFLGTGDGGVKSHGRSTLHRVGPDELQVGLGLLDAYKCWGDSGGPTFLLSAAGALHLIGVTSRAADSGGCRSAGIDTRVDAYRSWIEADMAEACGTARRPACAEPWRFLPN